MNLPCDIIIDLLPLYHDKVCSKTSNDIIEEHLSTCAKCNRELSLISKEINNIPLQPAKDETIKKFALAWKREKKQAFFKGLVITIIMFFSIITALNIVFEVKKMEGVSMQNKINNNDNCLFNKLYYKFDEPKVGDIILTEITIKNTPVKTIKRIVAIPGDTVKIKDNSLFINDKLSPYHPKGKVEPMDIDDEITLKENEYFVMGDNQLSSFDSRFSEFGVIKKEKIFSKFIFVLPSNPFVLTAEVEATSYESEQ